MNVPDGHPSTWATCKRGHILTPHRSKPGRRECVICQRERVRENMRRWRAKVRQQRSKSGEPLPWSLAGFVDRVLALWRDGAIAAVPRRGMPLASSAGQLALEALERKLAHSRSRQVKQQARRLVAIDREITSP